MISFYSSEVKRFQSEKPGSGKDVINRFINNDPKKLAGQENSRRSRPWETIEIREERIAPIIYRPFTRQWLYFSRD